MNLILRIRKKISAAVSRRLIPNEFTIISDDCWGGQLYRQLNIPYLTPTAGLWIRPSDYLKYIQEFDKIHQEDLVFIETDKDYPVATLSGVEIHFMHYKSKEEATQKYSKRFQRMQNNRLLTKIDFGKPGYTIAHIHKWNKLQIENSVALYPNTIKIPKEGVHNGVAIPDWQLDGAAMFDISRNYFNVFKWIRNGKVRNNFLYRASNILLFNPKPPKVFMNRLFNRAR